jgi:hypothetical protein
MQPPYKYRTGTCPLHSLTLLITCISSLIKPTKSPPNVNPLPNRSPPSSHSRLPRRNDNVLQITPRLQFARTRSPHGRTRGNATRAHRLDRRVVRKVGREEVAGQGCESVSAVDSSPTIDIGRNTEETDRVGNVSEGLYTARGRDEKK